MLKCKRSLCTVQNYYTTCIPKYEHCPGELSQDIMASSSWKEKTPCIKVGCLRPAVTFFFFFLLSPIQTRVRFDSALGVHFFKRRQREQAPSPLSCCSSSSSDEDSVKQKTEQSRGQAPPRWPPVPLVLMIQL